MPRANEKALTLSQAIEIVNTVQRGPGHPPLLIEAECYLCGEAFAIQPQDHSRATTHGHVLVCRHCMPEHRANSRKKK